MFYRQTFRLSAGPAAPAERNGKPAEAIKPQMTDTERKIFNLNKKVQDIVKLKERQTAGDVLLPNQLEKIAKENDLLAEIAALKLTR